MRRYIMEWDPEKRQVPLQKIYEGCRTDRFVFVDEKLLEKRDLFLWSKVISAQW